MTFCSTLIDTFFFRSYSTLVKIILTLLLLRRAVIINKLVSGISSIPADDASAKSDTFGVSYILTS